MFSRVLVCLYLALCDYLLDCYFFGVRSLCLNLIAELELCLCLYHCFMSFCSLLISYRLRHTFFFANKRMALCECNSVSALSYTCVRIGAEAVSGS